MNDRKFNGKWYRFSDTMDTAGAANQLKEYHKKKGRMVRVVIRRIKVKGIWWKRETKLYDVYVRGK